MGLQASQIDFTTACRTDEGFRKNKAEHGKSAEDFQSGWTFIIIKRRSFYRIQDIQRHGINVHFFQLKRHFHALIQRFAKPDNAAGADTDPCLLRRADDIFLVFHGMGSTDFRKIRRRRFDIAMNAGNARFLQPERLRRRNKPQGAADFDTYFLTDTLHDRDNFFKLIGIVLITAAGNNGEPDGACRFCFLCRFDNLFFRQQAVYLGACPVPAGLGAEFAVFLTVPASRIDDGAEIHRAAAEFLTDFIRHGKKQHGVFIFCTNEPPCLFRRDLSAIHDLFRQADNFLTSTFHNRTPLFTESFRFLYCYLGFKYKINNFFCQLFLCYKFTICFRYSFPEIHTQKARFSPGCFTDYHSHRFPYSLLASSVYVLTKSVFASVYLSLS